MNNGYSIKVKPTITDLDGNILREYEEQSNLITDWGLNRLGDTRTEGYLARQLAYVYLGVATGENLHGTNRSTGTSTLQQVGDVLSVQSGDFIFLAEDFGGKRVFQLSDNTTCIPVEWIDDTSIRVDTNRTLTNMQAVIWNVEQSKLNEYYRYSSTPEVDEGLTYNGSSTYILDDSNPDDIELTIARWRTVRFDFTTESKTITEAGWSSESAANGNLFGRIVFNEPIQVALNERLLIKITMYQKTWTGHIDSDPIYGQPANWWLDTNHLLNADFDNTLDNKISYINKTGGIMIPNGNYSSFYLEPAENEYALYFKNTAGLSQTIGDAGSRTYVQNSFKREWNNRSYTVMSHDFTELKEIWFGREYYGWQQSHCPRIIYDNFVNKSNTRKLDIQMTMKWNRVLPEFPVI